MNTPRALLLPVLEEVLSTPMWPQVGSESLLDRCKTIKSTLMELFAEHECVSNRSTRACLPPPRGTLPTAIRGTS